MSEIGSVQLHSKLFRRKHSTRQSHGLFALAKHLFKMVASGFGFDNIPHLRMRKSVYRPHFDETSQSMAERQLAVILVFYFYFDFHLCIVIAYQCVSALHSLSEADHPLRSMTSYRFFKMAAMASVILPVVFLVTSLFQKRQNRFADQILPTRLNLRTNSPRIGILTPILLFTLQFVNFRITRLVADGWCEN